MFIKQIHLKIKSLNITSKLYAFKGVKQESTYRNNSTVTLYENSLC